MATAYIVDAVRTPRGKGKANGALPAADVQSACLTAVSQRAVA